MILRDGLLDDFLIGARSDGPNEFTLLVGCKQCHYWMAGTYCGVTPDLYVPVRWATEHQHYAAPWRPVHAILDV